MTRNLLTIVFGVAIWLGQSGGALAFPSFNGNCSGCHGEERDAFEVTGFSGMADPAGGIGNLKYFIAVPDSSVGLTANVTNGNNLYAVALVDAFANPDLPAAQGPGSGWTFDDSGPDHFYVGPLTDNAAHTFDFAVPAGTPAGFYPFTFTVAGPGPSWADSESFYVRVVPELGTLALLSVGLGTIGFVARRRRKMPD